MEDSTVLPVAAHAPWGTVVPRLSIQGVTRPAAWSALAVGCGQAEEKSGANVAQVQGLVHQVRIEVVNY